MGLSQEIKTQIQEAMQEYRKSSNMAELNAFTKAYTLYTKEIPHAKYVEVYRYLVENCGLDCTYNFYIDVLHFKRAACPKLYDLFEKGLINKTAGYLLNRLLRTEMQEPFLQSHPEIGNMSVMDITNAIWKFRNVEVKSRMSEKRILRDYKYFERKIRYLIYHLEGCKDVLDRVTNLKARERFIKLQNKLIQLLKKYEEELR